MATLSIYRETAKLRYGTSVQIDGDGPIAVQLQCCGRVVLCSDPFTANVTTAAACCRGCYHVHKPFQNWHRQETLTTPRPQVYVPGNLGWDD
jgi:hypothetical protein